MRWLVPLLAFGGIALSPWAVGQTLKANERTFSSSKQIIIYGKDAKVRGAAAIEAERIRSWLGELLKTRYSVEHPIIVQLLPPGDAPPKPLLRIIGTGQAMKVQLDMDASAAKKGDVFEREVLEALLVERIYKGGRGQPGTLNDNPPAWLVDGLIALRKAQRGTVNLTPFLQLLEIGKAPRLSRFLREDPSRMDEVSRAIYGAESLSLLRALLEGPSGTADFEKFLAAMATTGGVKNPDEAILQNFTVTENSEDKVSRLWTLAIARYASQGRTDAMTARETRAALEKALELTNLPVPEKLRDGEHPLIGVARSKEGRFALEGTARKLLEVSLHAHPLYQPLVAEYRDIFERLSKKKLGGIEKRLTGALELQQGLGKRLEEIEDYMNWFEAAQMKTTSGQFEQDLPDEPNHTDPIGRYLDEVERQQETAR